MKKSILLGLFFALGFTGNANAELVYQQGAEIFAQDFENGLGENETMTGKFSLFENVSGDTVMGHKTSYGDVNNDNYSITLDLTGWSNILISYNAGGITESSYDYFKFSVKSQQMGTVVKYNSSGSIAGTNYSFDLSQFSGQLVTLTWNFTSDYGGYRPGIYVDDVSIVGDGFVENNPNPSIPGGGDGSLAVPVTLPLLGFMGLGLLGFARRRQAVSC